MSTTILSLESQRRDSTLAQITRDLRRDLARSDVPVHPVEESYRLGDKGDPFTIGQLALDLVTSGAVTALIGCLKAYLGRDRTLTFKVKRPDSSFVEITAHNIDSTELRDDLELLRSDK